MNGSDQPAGRAQQPPETERDAAEHDAAEHDADAAQRQPQADDSDAHAQSSETPERAGDSSQQKVAELENELLRSHAELDNYRKRVRREMESERKYAALPLLQDLVPVIDNLQRALQAARDSGNQEITQGVEMVASQLKTVLDRHGCQPVAEVGAVFDPNIHEAIAYQPSDEHPSGSVTHVHQLGYQLHDRVVRPAQVVVSSGPAQASTESPSGENA